MSDNGLTEGDTREWSKPGHTPMVAEVVELMEHDDSVPYAR